MSLALPSPGHQETMFEGGGTHDGVGVGVGVKVAVAVAVAVGVGVNVAVGVGVKVAVAVGVGVNVAVGVGVGVGLGIAAQYLPPVLKKLLPSNPPQTIIWVPVHTAV